MPVRYPNSKQFARELDTGKLGSAYLFLGEEEGEKDKFINRIAAMAFTEPGERANSTGRFHIENDEILAAADFALSSSMFYSRRLCIMYNIDALQVSRSGALFREVLENLPDSHILIMTSREKKPPSFLEKAPAGIATVQFWRYFDNDIFTYIVTAIKKLGMTIDDKAVELLIDRTGNDIKKIDDAIDMVRYSGAGKLITCETIQGCIDDVKEASVFDFIDLLFKRDPKAVILFKKIHEDGTPDLKIVYLVLRQAEMIEKYYSLVEAGTAVEEAMKQAGVYSKNRDSFWRYTESFPPGRLKKVFPLISGADYRLKSGSASRELVANPVFSLVTEILFSI